MSSDSHVAEHGAEPAFRQHHFINAEQQFDTSKLGMWLFLGTEIMFFTALIGTHLIYRNGQPTASMPWRCSLEEAAMSDSMPVSERTEVTISPMVLPASFTSAARRGMPRCLTG